MKPLAQGSVRFTCKVITRAKTTCWDTPRAGHAVVRLNAAPTDGKANAALRKFLAKSFATTFSEVHIEHGQSSRIKLIRVDHPGRVPAEIFD